MSEATRKAIDWVEQGLVPDAFIRAGIRRLCEQRLREIGAGDAERSAAAAESFVAEMEAAELAPVPHLANEQHYEVPARFFALALGPHLKYSSAWWPEGTATLEAAEARALAATCEHAGLGDGQDILELGCGWGSLTLWMAAHYRGSRITAVSNSASQRAWIESQARQRGFDNVRVITADMNVFEAPGRYDRIVSVEMFEHMRNYETLLGRVASWMAPAARCSCTSSPTTATPTRSRCATRATGWRSTSSPAASCRATTCCTISRRTCAWSTTGTWTAATTS